MKKIILAVILLAAAGGGIYYVLQKKKQNNSVNFKQEQIIGKWKIDSLAPQKDSTKDGLAVLLFAMDSTAKNIVYDFQPDGMVLVSHSSDSLQKKDTSSFAWNEKKELVWKEKSTDSIADTMTVIKLDKKDFVVQSADSTLIYFRKVK